MPQVDSIAERRRLNDAYVAEVRFDTDTEGGGSLNIHPEMFDTDLFLLEMSADMPETRKP